MLRKVVVSFISVIAAWAFALLCVTMYSFNDWTWKWAQVPADMLTFGTFLGVTIVVTWAVFLAPLVAVVNDDNPLYSLRVFPFFGAVYALIASTLLTYVASIFELESIPFLFYGALYFWPLTMILGAVTGLTFSVILKSQLFRSLGR
jgi:hypothetical protein